MACSRIKENSMEKPVNLLPQIMEFIFSFLDVQRLKVCRLICKAWNKQVCEILRTRSIVFLDSSVSYQVLHDLVEEGKKLRLPSPFQALKFKVEARGISNIRHYLLDSTLTIKKLNLCYPRFALRFTDADAYNNFWLLRHCADSLTHLRIGCMRILAPNPDWCLEFPQLEAFYFREIETHGEKDEDCNWLVRIIGDSPKLTHLELHGNDQVNHVLLHANFKRIQRLAVYWRNCRNIFDAIKTLEIERLRNFTLDYESRNDKDTLKILEVVYMYSDTLEQLKVADARPFNFLLFENNFPFCPMLHHLHLSHFKIGSNFLLRFPELRIFETVLAYCNPQSTIAAVSNVKGIGVRSLGLDDGIEIENEHHSTKAIFIRFCQQFHLAKSWKLSSRLVQKYGEIANSEQAHLLEGQIANLKIQFEREDSVAYDGVDLIANDDRTFASLQHIKGLKQICLGDRKECHVHYSRIDFSTLPQLESFWFYWNNALPIPVMIHKSQSLKRVYIRNCCGREYAYEVGKFFQQVPAANCGCKKASFWPAKAKNAIA